MGKEGQYIYCIIDTKQERNFGAIGIGGRHDEVLTIGYNDLSMVVSSHPLARFVVNSDNILTHEKVIEEVMKEFDSVLPVRFGTVAASADEVRNLLDRRYREFRIALREMDHKVELGVRGIWKDMEGIFSEIVTGNKEIKKLKERIEKHTNGDIEEKRKVGRLVQEALKQKKQLEAEQVVAKLRRTAVECKLNETNNDEVFLNGAFLVDKGRVKEFDNIMDDLSEEYGKRIKFIYTGPLPVFNFVNITIYPEQWEK